MLIVILDSSEEVKQMCIIKSVFVYYHNFYFLVGAEIHKEYQLLGEFSV